MNHWEQLVDEESGFPYLLNTVTGETKWVEDDVAEMGVWNKLWDGDGNPYFLSTVTGEVRWTLDENADGEWKTFMDGEGNPYLYNEATGESRWDEEKAPAPEIKTSARGRIPRSHLNVKADHDDRSQKSIELPGTSTSRIDQASEQRKDDVFAAWAASLVIPQSKTENLPPPTQRSQSSREDADGSSQLMASAIGIGLIGNRDKKPLVGVDDSSPGPAPASPSRFSDGAPPSDGGIDDWFTSPAKAVTKSTTTVTPSSAPFSPLTNIASPESPTGASRIGKSPIGTPPVRPEPPAQRPQSITATKIASIQRELREAYGDLRAHDRQASRGNSGPPGPRPRLPSILGPDDDTDGEVFGALGRQNETKSSFDRIVMQSLTKAPPVSGASKIVDGHVAAEGVVEIISSLDQKNHQRDAQQLCQPPLMSPLSTDSLQASGSMTLSPFRDEKPTGAPKAHATDTALSSLAEWISDNKVGDDEGGDDDGKDEGDDDDGKDGDVAALLSGLRASSAALSEALARNSIEAPDESVGGVADGDSSEGMGARPSEWGNDCSLMQDINFFSHLPYDDDDNDDRVAAGAGSQFDVMFSRSIVIRQHWPWTKLVDPKTDKMFYHNEVEGIFQWSQPKDFDVGAEEPTSSRFGGMQRFSPVPMSRTGKSPVLDISADLRWNENMEALATATAPDMMKAFKEELMVRRSRYARDEHEAQARLVLTTSAAKERGLQLQRDVELVKALGDAASDEDDETMPADVDGHKRGGKSKFRKLKKLKSGKKKFSNSKTPSAVHADAISRLVVTGKKTSLREIDLSIHNATTRDASAERVAKTSSIVSKILRFDAQGTTSTLLNGTTYLGTASSTLSQSGLVHGTRSTLVGDELDGDLVRQEQMRRERSIFATKGSEDFEAKYAPPEGLSEMQEAQLVQEAHALSFQPFKSKRWPSKSTSDLKRMGSGSGGKVENEDSILIKRLRQISASFTPDPSTITMTKDAAPEVKVTAAALLAAQANNKKGKGSNKRSMDMGADMEKHNALIKQMLVVSEAHHHAAAIRELVEKLSDACDVACDVLRSRLNGGSWIECEMGRQYLLEAAVMQRCRLMMPFSLRDAKAYPSVPITTLCPSSLTPHDLDVLLDKQMLGDYTMEVERQWQIYTPQDESIRAEEGEDDTSVRPTKANPVFFVHPSSGTIQTGTPFDLRFHKMRSVVQAEMWIDYETLLKGKRGASEAAAKSLSVLTDKQSGLLFYDPSQDAYSPTLHIDPFSGGKPANVYLPKGSRSQSRSPHPKQPVHNHISAQSKHISPFIAGAVAGSMCPQDRIISGYKHQSSVVRDKREVRQDILEPECNVWATAFLTPNVVRATLKVNRAANASPDPSKLKLDFQLGTPSRPGTAMKTTSNRFGGNDFVDKPRDDDADLIARLGAADTDNLVKGAKDMKQPGTAKSKKKSHPGHGHGDTNDPSILEFEKFLVDVVGAGKDALLLEEYKRNSVPLYFESIFSRRSYAEYRERIQAVVDQPLNAVPLLEMSIWFMTKDLPTAATAAYIRALELVAPAQRSSEYDSARTRLLAAKMAAAYGRRYRKAEFILSTVASCSESDVILAQGAICLRQIGCSQNAELLFIGALLLNPLCPEALRGYAHMLLEESGNAFYAHRYLSRVPPTSAHYPMSRIEAVWTLELMGSDAATVMQALKVALASGKRDRATSLALHSCGHFYHVRGDGARAFDFYKRSLKAFPNNPVAMLLAATLANDISYSNVEIDALYRRGLVLLPQSPNTWVALLAAADSTVALQGDLHTAERLLWEAVRLSLSRVVWPAIALAHFHQYIRGNVKAALRILTRCCRRRQNFFEPTTYPEDDAWEHDDLVDEYGDPIGSMVDEEDAEKHLPEGFVARDPSVAGQNAALLTAMAFCHFDMQREKTAKRLVSFALTIDPEFGPARRCLGLLLWNENRRENKALGQFKKAVEVRGDNPYNLRCYAITNAIEHNYEVAHASMKAAVMMSSCALSHRMLGLMSYIYTNDRVATLGHLTRAIELSNGIDVEALRLKGQVLMEIGQHLEARVALQQALQVCPGDPITLASLALVITALGYHAPTDVEWVDYDSQFELALDLRHLIDSTDPEELFHAALSPGLEEIVASRARLRRLVVDMNEEVRSPNANGSSAMKTFDHGRPTSRSGPRDETKLFDGSVDFHDEAKKHVNQSSTSSTGGGRAHLPGAASAANLDATYMGTGSATAPVDPPCDVLYWCGMCHIQKGSKGSLEKAARLFSRAAQVEARHSDSAPHPLAMYMLGWIHELDGDLEAAERLYSYSLQLEPMDPLHFLRLLRTMDDTLKFVKGLVKTSELMDAKAKKASKNRSNLKKAAAVTSAMFDDIAKLTHTVATSNSALYRNTSNIGLTMLGTDKSRTREADLDTRFGEGEHKFRRARDDGRSTESAVFVMRQRLLMHERVQGLAKLRQLQLKPFITGLQPPAKFVHVDAFWGERALHALSRCDDWAWLLRSTNEFGRHTSER